MLDGGNGRDGDRGGGSGSVSVENVFVVMTAVVTSNEDVLSFHLWHCGIHDLITICEFFQCQGYVDVCVHPPGLLPPCPNASSITCIFSATFRVTQIIKETDIHEHM